MSKLISHPRWIILAAVLTVGALLIVGLRQARASEKLLLPNLVGDPPSSAGLEISDTEGGLVPPGKAQLLLRFDGYVHNDGEGALDIRGSRAEPHISVAAEAEVARRKVELKEIEEGKRTEEPQELSEATEHELATPAMGVSQRAFTTNAGAPSTNPEESKAAQEKFDKENETYLVRPHEDLASKAKMSYVNADGHHHWHLQHVAKYSLWNATKTAEVAPAQKVGFCLDDSEHVERSVGPPNRVYSDHAAPFRDFCQHYIPYATSVYEGISPGWRDAYISTLAFQWVDVSDVLPGEYWLREEVNPEHLIQEVGLGEKVAYATKPTIVPGFTALAQTVTTQVGEAKTVTFTSRAWHAEGEVLPAPHYAIIKPPQHGTLGSIEGGTQVVYKPEAGYTGNDEFTYTASDPNSEFPRAPAIAAVSVDVGNVPTPSVTISGAPAEMLVGTSVQLSALVTADSPSVTWNASAGAITSNGLYTAPSQPPPNGTVVITARSAKGAEGQVAIVVKPVPPPAAAPAATPAATVPKPSTTTSRLPAISRPVAMLVGRKLIMTTRVGKAGRVRLRAYIGRRLLGGCAANTPGNRVFTCRLTLGSKVRLSSPISVLATLQVGHTTLRSLRPAARVPKMKMGAPRGRAVRAGVRGSSTSLSSLFWCSPSMAM